MCQPLVVFRLELQVSTTIETKLSMVEEDKNNSRGWVSNIVLIFMQPVYEWMFVASVYYLVFKSSVSRIKIYFE